MTRSALRDAMQATRSALGEPARSVLSGRIVDQVMAHVVKQSCRHVALFWPLLERGEVDLRALDAQLRARSILRYYPCAKQPALRRLEPGQRMSRSRRGFLAPPSAAPEAHPGALDLVLVPALAADARGYRLGYGAGYYDRLLPRYRQQSVCAVVVFQAQLLPSLDAEPHDIPCQALVTEMGWNKVTR